MREEPSSNRNEIDTKLFIIINPHISLSLSHSMLLLVDSTSCDPSQRGSAAVSQLAVPATEATSPPPPPPLIIHEVLPSMGGFMNQKANNGE